MQISPSERAGHILDAAFAEFAKRGYAGTRLEDVARRAGVAKGLPIFYFLSKKNLFCEVVRRDIVPIWSDLIDHAASAQGPTADLLRQTLSTMYSRLIDNARAREVMRLLIAEGPRFPELTELYYEEVVVRGLRIWKALLRRGVVRGEFADGPVRKYPQVLYGPALMAAIWQLLFCVRHPLNLEHWFDSHVDLVLRGLESRPVPGARCG